MAKRGSLKTNRFGQMTLLFYWIVEWRSRSKEWMDMGRRRWWNHGSTFWRWGWRHKHMESFYSHVVLVIEWLRVVLEMWVLRVVRVKTAHLAGTFHFEGCTSGSCATRTGPNCHVGFHPYDLLHSPFSPHRVRILGKKFSFFKIKN